MPKKLHDNLVNELKATDAQVLAGVDEDKYISVKQFADERENLKDTEFVGTLASVTTPRLDTIYVQTSDNSTHRHNGVDWIQLSGKGSVSSHANLGAFPTTGEADIVYIAQDTNTDYYWNGTNYVSLKSTGSTQLTKAQVESPTDTTFGEVSGERLLEFLLSKIQTTIRDSANATDTEIVSEKAIRTALDALPTTFIGNSDTINAYTGLANQFLRVNVAENAVEAIALIASLVVFDNSTANLAGTPSNVQAAIEAIKNLIDNQPDQLGVADIPARDALTSKQAEDGTIVHVIDASADATVTAGWAKYQRIGGAWFKYLSLEELQSIATITDAQLQTAVRP